MTKVEAINAIIEGKTITHRHFDKDEHMKLTTGGNYIFEDGCICDPIMFWMDRRDQSWNNDWSIVKD